MKIRFKLFIAFGSILLLSIFLIFIATSSIDNMLYYKSLNEDIDKLNMQLVKVNMQAKDFMHHGFKEKDFLEEGKSAVLDEFDNAYLDITEILLKLESEKELVGSGSGSTLFRVKAELSEYHDIFKELVTVFGDRGFKDHGVEGTLRAAIHSVENSGFDFDIAKMLMLRRHEKDFFLRKDLKYLSKFNEAVNEFYQSIKSVNTKRNAESFLQQTTTLKNIRDYKQQFNRIVQLEKQIGLTDEKGLKGQMAMTFSALQPQIHQLSSRIKKTSKALINESRLTLFIIFGVQLIVGILLILFYSGLLTRAIKEIKGAMVALADGYFPEKLEVRTGDEIGETKGALNGLMERIKAAVTFASALGNGQFTKDYESEYKNDVLAKSIMSMQEKLVTAENQQSRINWVNKGLAEFTEILKNESENLELLGDKIMKTLVQYLKANQGALYILDADSRKLSRLSTFAYGRKKYENHEIEEGQGIVGQCLIEKETVYVTNVPNGYTKITSGLGEATPGSLLVVPLKIRETLMGVIEIASFHLLEEYQIKFVEKASENIANILSNKQTTERTQLLLEESQERAEILAAQEEEMRQNTEELQAIQEEMQRQKDEVDAKIALLKTELKSKDNKIKTLESQIKVKEQLEMLHKLENQMNQY